MSPLAFTMRVDIDPCLLTMELAPTAEAIEVSSSGRKFLLPADSSRKNHFPFSQARHVTPPADALLLSGLPLALGTRDARFAKG